MRYVESNPLRAELVNRSADWPWGSLAIRCGADKPVALSDGPVERPRRWKGLVERFSGLPLDEIETCIQRGREQWRLKIAKELALQVSLNPRRRPKKEQQA